MLANKKSNPLTGYMLIVAAFIFILLCSLFSDSIDYIIILFLIVGSPFLLYEGFSNPAFFILIFIAFTLCRIQELIPQLQSAPIIFIMAILGSMSLFYNVMQKKIVIYWCREMNFFLAFFLWMTASTLFSGDITLSFASWLGAFSKIGIGFFLISWMIKDRNDFFWFIIICITGGLCISFITLFNKYNAIGLIENTRASINSKTGLLGDPNDLAFFLLIPFSFATTIFVSKFLPTLLRLLGLITSMIIISAILATQSRGGFIGLLVVIICFFLRYTKLYSLTALLSFLAFIVLYSVSEIKERSSPQMEQLDESSSNRIVAWKAGLNMALHHPLFGVGLYNFRENFFNYSGGYKADMVAHSIWITLLAEGGFVGCGLFIACIYCTFKAINRTIQCAEKMGEGSDKRVILVLANSIYFALIGYFVSGTFLTQAYSWGFYILFAISISLSRYSEKINNTLGERTL